ncbi:MAG: flagellar protein FlgN, partial [Candidatus Nanopelagicales bacterium]
QEPFPHTDLEEASMDMSGLSSLLWRERDILDNLLFKLDVQQLLLMSGRSGWLVRASREIETALEQVRIIELERAVRFERIAEDLDSTTAPSLSAIAESAEEPWKSLLTEHYEAFLEIAAQIQKITSLNRELASAAQVATEAILAGIQGDSDPVLHLYAQTGAAEKVDRKSVFVDEGL